MKRNIEVAIFIDKSRCEWITNF